MTEAAGINRPQTSRRYCAVPLTPVRALPASVDAGRARLILAHGRKWANGTVLHYYFFDKETDGRNVPFTDGSTRWLPWATSEEEKNVVRAAFRTWSDIGVGLVFSEVTDRSEAEIRIGFERGDGAWSYIARDVLDIGVNERTMNFGWDLTADDREIDTAIHEVGHTLGFPHEHQNPNAGIEWDEEAVYRSLGGPPNYWDREKTHYNIIRKITPDEVQGSSWDPNSVMQYPFEPGLIKRPEEFFKSGLTPAGGLSQRDRTWVVTFYPPLAAGDHAALRPFQPVELAPQAGAQSNFLVRPDETRQYELRVFGAADVVMVLFEKVGGEWRYLAGDDDSAEERNASLSAKLFTGREYALRVRMYAQQSARTAVMMW